MARRSLDRGRSPLPEKIGGLLQETRWLALGALALFVGMALWGFNRADPGWSHAASSPVVHNPAGRAGAWLADLLLYLFGLSAWWWIALFAVFVFWGVRRLRDEVGDYEPHPLYLALFGFTFLIVASASLEALRFYSLKAELPLGPGGVLGIELSRVLGTHLGYTGATVRLARKSRSSARSSSRKKSAGSNCTSRSSSSRLRRPKCRSPKRPKNVSSAKSKPCFSRMPSSA